MRLGCLLTVAAALVASSACGAQALLLPAGVAYDAAGNLFVADTRANQIFELSLAGVTSVVAGTGAQGFGGDGGAASSALLDRPAAVAVAADGTVYIADTGNQRIRSVVGGLIQTVAGSGAKGFSGDGGDALHAKLNGPVALAVDGGGGLLIADSGNHRLRRLFAGVLTTVAGTGVQGFSGDGAAALLAQLDTPAGVAVASDGRIFVADSHNHRIRIIGTDGKIATFAGNGVKGFSGDGGAGTSASLFLPRGVAATPSGDVVFADSDNQRLRLVNAQGVIATVAGNGVQGSSVEGAAGTSSPLNSPRGVAVSSFSAPVFADAHNRVVREIASNADLYALLGGTAHVAVVTLADSENLTYGQGTVGAVVAGAAPQAQGTVTLFDGGVNMSAATLAGGSVALPADGLSAGQHTLTAAFAGDGVHAAAVSAGAVVTVAPRPAIAAAHGVTIAYGAFAPALTGTVTGILPRDEASVVVSFLSSAPDLAAVGTYPITASLGGEGSSNYVLTLDASSGALQVVQAPAVVAMGASQASYAGLPVTLSASVGTATRGTPSGAVRFSDGGAIVASGTIVGGVASAIYLSPGAGAHSITASYAGDRNFLTSSSSPSVVTVSAMPDFSLGVNGSAAETVQGGSIASYAMQVAAQPGPFSGSVTLSASGLPSGAVVSFSPAAVVPGNGSAVVTMTVHTVALAMRTSRIDVRWAWVLVVAVPWMRRRKAMGSMLFLLFFIVGCGDRSLPTPAAHAPQTSSIIVTGTGTNLAGSVVTHTAAVTLTVQ